MPWKNGPKGRSFTKCLASNERSSSNLKTTTKMSLSKRMVSTSMPCSALPILWIWAVSIVTIFTPLSNTTESKRLLASSSRYRESHSVAIGFSRLIFSILQEVNNVFKVYGITVDPRHLTLVASFMTSGGGYRAFNRVGMFDCTSPLQQMTFETATEFLKNAALAGLYFYSPFNTLVMFVAACFSQLFLDSLFLAFQEKRISWKRLHPVWYLDFQD